MGLCPILVVPGVPREVAKLPRLVAKTRELWLQPELSEITYKYPGTPLEPRN